MKIKEIAFSGYSVTDVKKARAFYEGILGLKPSSVFEGEGMAFIEYWIGSDEDVLVIGSGAEKHKPGPTGAMVALEVEDFADALKTIKKHKVPVIMEPYESGVCTMMMIEDPDKNMIMIHKRKKD